MRAVNYSLELEQRVLQTLMHYGTHKNTHVQKAILKLSTNTFYNLQCGHIFGLIRECFKKQEDFNFVDILVLIPKDDSELHGALTWIIDNYGKFHVGEATFEHDVNRLVVLMNLRKQVQLCTQMVTDVEACPNPVDAQQILISALQEISSISFQESKHGIGYDEIADAFFQGLLALDLKLPTTCEQLNQLLDGGIMSKSLITIGAGSGVGKTGFALFLLDAIARNMPGSESLFFSLEMEYKQIWMRHIGVCAGKQFDTLTEIERVNAIAKAMELSVQIYDSSTSSEVADIDFILTTARLRAMDKKISVIVVDYLGLVGAKGKFESNALKQTEITSKLARIAIELDCVVIALSQINRAPSARATDDRCPYPSDASGSSGSYFSSTLWLGVDRPELYQDDPCYQNQFVIKCRKNRFGSAFELILAFNDGTFAEVPNNYFRKPIPDSKSSQKRVFPAHGRDFYQD